MDPDQTFAAAAIVAPHPLAGAAGRDVLVEGGSVVAAVLAAAAVCAVVVPDRCGLGADALWLVREAGPRGRVRVLDARGAVAAAARPSFYREREREAVPPHGPEAVIVAPGAAAGWAEAHRLSTALGGRLPLSRLLAPALAAARGGWSLSERDAEALAAAPAAEPGFAAAFLDAEGRLPEAGGRRSSPALASVLEHLIDAGLDDAYRGDVARELAADLDALSCPLGRDDLRAVEARWREPLTLDLDRHAFAAPPTRSGLRAAAALGLLEGSRAAGFDLARPDGFPRWHGLVEASRAADRMLAALEEAGEDPAALLDPARLARAALRLDRKRAAPAAVPAAPLAREAAAWIGAVDRDGAAAVCVQTLGGGFGSGVVSARTGILLNGRGAALALDPDRGPMLRPGRRVPLRALPALLSSPRDGRVVAFGATGPGAPNVAAQLAERLARGTAAGEALLAARFALGATPDGRDAAVLVESDRDEVPAKALEAAGHALVELVPGALRAADVVMRDGSGRVAAASDGGAVDGV